MSMISPISVCDIIKIVIFIDFVDYIHTVVCMSLIFNCEWHFPSLERLHAPLRSVFHAVTLSSLIIGKYTVCCVLYANYIASCVICTTYKRTYVIERSVVGRAFKGRAVPSYTTIIYSDAWCKVLVQVWNVEHSSYFSRVVPDDRCKFPMPKLTPHRHAIFFHLIIHLIDKPQQTDCIQQHSSIIITSGSR